MDLLGELLFGDIETPDFLLHVLEVDLQVPVFPLDRVPLIICYVGKGMEVVEVRTIEIVTVAVMDMMAVVISVTS